MGGLKADNCPMTCSIQTIERGGPKIWEILFLNLSLKSLPGIISSKNLEVDEKTTSDADMIGERMRRLSLRAIKKHQKKQHKKKKDSQGK